MQFIQIMGFSFRVTIGVRLHWFCQWCLVWEIMLFSGTPLEPLQRRHFHTVGTKSRNGAWLHSIRETRILKLHQTPQ